MVWVLHQDREGNLWIGTMLGGLDRFDRKTGNWRHYRHDPDDAHRMGGSLSNDWVSAIYEDRSGVLWIGTQSGLDRFEPETDSALGEGTFTHYQADPDGPPRSPSNNVIAIHQGSEGDFWVGTEGGLYRFDHEKKSWSQPYRHDSGVPDSLNRDMVLTFLQDRDGVLWIGTASAGLIGFDPGKETFTQYQNDPGDPHSLSSNAVLSILQNREGVLWIGTPGGLDRFEPEMGTFTHYREKDGMPNDTVYCTVEDRQGNLWVSTTKGLSRFDPQRGTFRNYDVTDGLQSNEFNGMACHVSDSAEIFFGGIHGFNAFFPDRVQDNPTIPPVVLTYLAQGGEEVDLGMAVASATEVTFKWPDNAFEFEFAALGFAQPEKNQYAYYLEGFEETWNEVGTRRYGQYTNLPGGTYTLRLKGSNNDGIWNEAGAAIKITIVPPFWATWWFRGVGLLAVVGAIFGGYRLRVMSLEARGRELESKVEQRTAELMRIEEALRQSEMEKAVTAERNRLARELHDSVTQSLYSLTLLAAAGQRMIEAKDLQQSAGNQARLGEIAQQALQEMRLLVYELRPLALEREGLIGALEQRLEAVERRAGIQARVLVEGEVKLAPDLEEELYRIAQEALNNALKHAGATQVALFIRVTEGFVTLEVTDNGQGSDLAKMHTTGGLGLISMQERANKIGGRLTFHSAPGEGTRVRMSVRLPVIGNRPLEANPEP